MACSSEVKKGKNKKEDERSLLEIRVKEILRSCIFDASASTVSLLLPLNFVPDFHVKRLPFADAAWRDGRLGCAFSSSPCPTPDHQFARRVFHRVTIFLLLQLTSISEISAPLSPLSFPQPVSLLHREPGLQGMKKNI